MIEITTKSSISVKADRGARFRNETWLAYAEPPDNARTGNVDTTISAMRGPQSRCDTVGRL